MAERRKLENRLREKLGRFLKKAGPVGQATKVLRSWEEQGWNPILFGGVVRDLVVLGNRYYPRDVDVVLQHVETSELQIQLKHTGAKLNRFGGLHLCLNHWSFDVWPLQSTWAFTTDHDLAPTIANLPKTTFLDVEAIAITLSGQRVDKIYSNGFFEAIERRCVNINYRKNPYPALCAIRSVMIASKLRFRVSADVAKYFVEAVRDYGLTSMIEAQERHYGRVFFRSTAISTLEDYFYASIDANDTEDVTLPNFLIPEQLSLWS